MVTPCNSQLPTWVRIGMQIICELRYSVGCNLNNNILLKTVVVLHIKTYFLLYQVVIGFLWLIFFFFALSFILTYLENVKLCQAVSQLYLASPCWLSFWLAK